MENKHLEQIPQTAEEETLLPDVHLGIREPDGDKNFMITFDAKAQLDIFMLL